MSGDLHVLVDEVFATGTLKGLPSIHFINGRRVPSSSGRTMDIFDPGSGRPFAHVAAGNGNDIEAAVAAAKTALVTTWRQATPAERGRILYRAAGLLRTNADRFAVAESLDSGKPLGEAQGDVAGAARAFEYYAGACDKLQGETIPLGQDYLAYTLNEPVGVTAHITPWNFPISTMARSVAPALAAGCTVVAKPAEQTPITALMLADILTEAGLPDGVYNVVTGTGPDAGAPLVAHEDVRHVTFTGSVATGTLVMQAAARNITRVTLELGGKSPVIVLADCDKEQALTGVLGAIYENAGQVCSAGSRLVVERTIHDEFIERLAQRTKALTLGHGLRNPNVGPINSPAQLDKIVDYVEGAKARGISVAAGGNRAADPQTGDGWFFEPTILDNVSATDIVVQEEIFGPVLAVQTIESIDEAIECANGTPYGLVAGLYTQDITKALRLARDIDAGQIYINEYFAGGIEVPFGGNKKSGFGREKGLEALRSYCKIKSIAAKI